MHFLFPADPIRPSAPDDAYAEELAALQAAGVGHSLFSFEDFEAGRFKARPPLPSGEKIIYRGWMLAPSAYEILHSAISSAGAAMAVSPAHYQRCHHLPEWYPLCRDITPETVFAERHADFVAAVSGKDWPAYFVKDFVKSLNTARGSVAATPEDIAEVVSLIERFRGRIEGGVCIRRFEELIPETEERYFVFAGAAHGREGSAPALVHELATRIDSPFFSVDLIQSASGRLRLIEIGDGQVSDRKKWSASQFSSVFRGL